jgi:predicted Zn-dependent protease
MSADTRGALRSLFALGDAPVRYLDRGACETLFARIAGFARGGGETAVSVESRWTGNLRWALNRVTTAGDATEHIVRIVRSINGARGQVETNKLDDASLRLSIAAAERMAQFYNENPDAWPLPGPQRYPATHVWSDATYALDAVARSRAAEALVGPAARAGLHSAGYVEVAAQARAVLDTDGLAAYGVATHAECSVTVRDTAGTASGWAGTDDHDWARIDVAALAARAQQKCVASGNPRAIEPGRYTVILEPQAVHELLVYAIYVLDRFQAEQTRTVYTKRPGYSRIGERVFDERITISTDPSDPTCGYLPFDAEGYPYRAVTWVEHGVLKELAYDRRYALSQLGHDVPLPNPFAYRVAGGPTSLEEMIATTERGLLVTRLSDVHVIDWLTLLCTGVTRDGMWLIERGKITRPVKNLRFTDSPMFAFANVAQVGAAARVHAPFPVMVPAIKVRDFNFTALADAV